MARAAIPITRTSRVAVDPIAVGVSPDAIDGARFANDGSTALLVWNTGVGPHTITIPTPQTVDNLSVADLSFVVPAGGWRVLGPFPAATYGQSSGADQGQVYVDADGAQDELICVALRIT